MIFRYIFLGASMGAGAVRVHYKKWVRVRVRVKNDGSLCTLKTRASNVHCVKGVVNDHPKYASEITSSFDFLFVIENLLFQLFFTTTVY